MNNLVVIDVSDLETLIGRVVEAVVRQHVDPVERVLTPEQVAKALSVSASLVKSWARDLPPEERCPHMRAGKHYRFRLSRVVNWLEECGMAKRSLGEDA